MALGFGGSRPYLSAQYPEKLLDVNNTATANPAPPRRSNLEQARFNMVEQQVRTWEVLDAQVLEVMRTVPREEFVPDRYRKLAFSDVRLPLGHDQVMMKPVEEGRVLQALALKPADTVIEIGTGSGFLACCLGRLAGHVTTLEIFEELAERARQRLVAGKAGNVDVMVADALAGWRPAEPVDAVVVTGSVPEIPELFGAWLKEGGRLFAIRGASPAMEAVCRTSLGGGEWATESLFETDLPRLVGAEDPDVFEF